MVIGRTSQKSGPLCVVNSFFQTLVQMISIYMVEKAVSNCAISQIKKMNRIP